MSCTMFRAQLLNFDPAATASLHAAFPKSSSLSEPGLRRLLEVAKKHKGAVDIFCAYDGKHMATYKFHGEDRRAALAHLLLKIKRTDSCYHIHDMLRAVHINKLPLTAKHKKYLTKRAARCNKEIRDYVKKLKIR